MGIYVAIVVLALLLCGLAVILYLVYGIAFGVPGIRPRKPIFDIPDDGTEQSIAARVRKNMDEIRAADGEDVFITSHDGLRLHGRYYHNRDGAPLEIFFHGYRSTPYCDGAFAFFYDRGAGYNVLLVDQRAHGLSEGRTITFGVCERMDVRAWCDYAIARFGASQKILLSGVSMGAATVLMASSLDLPANVRGVIADCPYSSPRAILTKVAADMRYPKRAAYLFMRIAARLLGGFDPEAASAVEAVSQTRLPILLIHGEGDTFVPFAMSREIFAACGSPDKQFEPFPEADHAMSSFWDAERYTAVTEAFKRRVLDDATA